MGTAIIHTPKKGSVKGTAPAPDKKPNQTNNKCRALALYCLRAVASSVMRIIAVFLAKLFNVPVTKSVFTFWLPTAVTIVFIIPVAKPIIAIDRIALKLK